MVFLWDIFLRKGVKSQKKVFFLLNCGFFSLFLGAQEVKGKGHEAAVDKPLVSDLLTKGTPFLVPECVEEDMLQSDYYECRLNFLRQEGLFDDFLQHNPLSKPLFSSDHHQEKKELKKQIVELIESRRFINKSLQQELIEKKSDDLFPQFADEATAGLLMRRHFNAFYASQYQEMREKMKERYYTESDISALSFRNRLLLFSLNTLGPLLSACSMNIGALVTVGVRIAFSWFLIRHRGSETYREHFLPQNVMKVNLEINRLTKDYMDDEKFYRFVEEKMPGFIACFSEPPATKQTSCATEEKIEEWNTLMKEIEKRDAHIEKIKELMQDIDHHEKIALRKLYQESSQRRCDLMKPQKHFLSRWIGMFKKSDPFLLKEINKKKMRAEQKSFLKKAGHIQAHYEKMKLTVMDTIDPSFISNDFQVEVSFKNWTRRLSSSVLKPFNFIKRAFMIRKRSFLHEKIELKAQE